MLWPVEQALALAWAVQVHHSTAADELQPWQAAPYIDAVLGQRTSLFMLRASCHLLR